jgi:hypothetical protein
MSQLHKRFTSDQVKQFLERIQRTKSNETISSRSWESREGDFSYSSKSMEKILNYSRIEVM